MSGGRLVYSTDGGRQKSAPEKDKHVPASGPCKMRLEKNGRGGKSVTVLFQLPFDSETARKHLKEMQGRFGCGATFKEGRIEFQGDLRDRVESYFQESGLKLVRAGG